MRIITGKLKGRQVSFTSRKFKNADVTTQKVKEALFSIIGNRIYDSVFLDLFGCSGQIGFEAFSRGADVIINERDKQRFDFIWHTAESFGIIDSIRLFNYSDTVCLRYLSRKNEKVDICFLDPPYIKKRGEVDYYGKLLSQIDQAGILADGASVIIQYYSKNIVSGITDSFNCYEVKEYGSNSLSFFEYSYKP